MKSRFIGVSGYKGLRKGNVYDIEIEYKSPYFWVYWGNGDTYYCIPYSSMDGVRGNWDLNTEDIKMDGYDYQKLAMRTAPKNLSRTELMVNSALGLAGESGEYSDLIKKHLYQGHELDVMHLAKELGDILWYVAMGCEALGVSMSDVMQMNIDKLAKRYPDGFDSDRSQHRAKGDI